MPDFTIGGASGAAFGGQVFGAQVVAKTLDFMNNQGGMGGGMQFAPVDKQTFGAAVVGKTLDFMNSNQFGSSGMSAMSNDFDFQKSVLNQAFSTVGNVLNTVG
jgi:hypothetical protein